MRPTPRAIYLAAAGSLPALLPILVDARLWTAWPIFVGWLLLALGADALMAPRHSRISHAVELPPQLYVGENDRARITVRLPSARATTIDLTLDLSDELAPAARQREVVAGGECRSELPLVALRRGTARVEALWLRLRGPLGLMASTRRVPLDREIPVVANILPVRAAAIRFASDRKFRAGLKIERFRGEGTEFESLKEFVPGDDSRAMDWKHSARHRKLLGRQYRAERNHQVVLAVDTGHLMSETLEGVIKLDHALNAMLLLAYVCLKAGDRVGLFTFAARIGLFVEPQGGMRTHRAMTRIASQVGYSDEETNFTLGLTTLSQRVRRRSLIIVLTDFVDTITAELMIENLSRLAHRHVVLFVSLRDPLLERIASRAPSSALELNRAVMAQNFLRDRELVLKRLRRLGILHLDAEPATIGAEMIDRYLDIKRRERV